MSVRLHMPIVSWRVMRALTMVGYWGRIRIFMFTVSWRLHKLLWYFTSLHANTIALLPIKKMSKFYIFTFFFPLDLNRHRKFERLLLVFGHWTVTAEPKYMVFHILKEKSPGFFPIWRNPNIFNLLWVLQLTEKNYKRLPKSVHISNKVVLFAYHTCERMPNKHKFLISMLTNTSKAGGYYPCCGYQERHEDWILFLKVCEYTIFFFLGVFISLRVLKCNDQKVNSIARCVLHIICILIIKNKWKYDGTKENWNSSRGFIFIRNIGTVISRVTWVRKIMKS